MEAIDGANDPVVHRPGSAPLSQQAIRERCVHPTGRFVEFPRAEIEGTMPDRFARQAAQHPDRLAIKTRRHELTYRALHRAMTAVARRLRERLGDGPRAVGLLFEQGAPAIWSALGTMAAGKMCVPLDPAHPRARTAFILQDSGAGAILTERDHAALARERGHEVIVVDEIDAADGDRGEPCPASAGDPAYLLYTSGATGHPKGVVRTHRSLLHFQMNYANALHICPDDRLAMLRSMSVLGGVRDIYAALLNGAALYALDVKREGVLALAGWLRDHEITIAFFGAPLFRHFAEDLGGRDGFPHLRVIRLGSDTVQKSDVELYRRHFASTCILVNGLGSTETSTVCKYFIDKDTRIVTSTVPVGYALADIEAFVLGADGREVPTGEAGEIAVRGAYLAEGYWRRPDVTAAAFRPSPTGHGDRVFLTGNLGLRHPDGCLEHLGRSDFQVKVRGYRVELAEVERALMAIEGVREAVVVAQPGPAGESRLVGYVVPGVRSALAVGAIRQALRATLPDHMVPADVVLLDAMPLNATSKVDRTALPRPGRTRPELGTPFEAPRTAIEETLSRIWTDVLGLDRVGVHDGFLELGGDSLLAARVVSGVLDALDVDVPVRALLESPTVATMAVVVIARRIEMAGPDGEPGPAAGLA